MRRILPYGPANGRFGEWIMRFVFLFLRVTCAKVAFVTGLGIAPAVAVNISHAPSVAALSDHAPVR